MIKANNNDAGLALHNMQHTIQYKKIKHIHMHMQMHVKLFSTFSQVSAQRYNSTRGESHYYFIFLQIPTNEPKSSPRPCRRPTINNNLKPKSHFFRILLLLYSGFLHGAKPAVWIYIYWSWEKRRTPRGPRPSLPISMYLSRSTQHASFSFFLQKAFSRNR